MQQNPAPRLFLIDSFALAFRIFFAFSRNPLKNSKGQDNSLVHGYWSNLFRILASQKPSHFAVVKDMGKKTFRHDLYPDYKANRADMPEEMKEQLPRLEEILQASGLPVLGREGYEADDLMAHLAIKAAHAGFEVYLVTKDKDMGQIVSDRIRMFQLEKGNEIAIQGPAEILEKFGVPPEQMRDYLALVGDASDNVPGVPKVGPKTAAELLLAYHDLDGIYANLDKVTRKALHENLAGNKEKAYLSRELVTLQATHDFGITLDELKFTGVDRTTLKSLFQEHELQMLSRQVSSVPDRAFALAGMDEMDTEHPQEKQPAPEYILVDSEESLRQLEEELADADLVALDTETDSLVGWKANLVGLCLSFREDRGYYLPIGHRELQQAASMDLFGDGIQTKGKLLPGQLPAKALRTFLTHLCKSKHRKLLFHNAKYDLQVLSHFGVEVQSPILDSMLGVWLLDPGQPSFGLDDQVRRRLGHEMIPIDALIGKGKAQISFAEVPLAKACEYGAEDAVFTLRLWNRVQPELLSQNLMKVLEEQEIPLVSCLVDMEREGICIDAKELESIRKDLTLRLSHSEQEIVKLAGGEAFNLNSPKQLGAVLFEKLGLPTIKKTSTGYSTDAATLEELRGLHPIVESVITYRELSKLLNTYVEVLPTLVDANTGRVHTSFMQTGTATGRLSSRDPNLQNIPIRTAEGKRIRAAFVAKPGHVLLSADYSQIELRMLAHLTNDPNLCEAYRAGQDIHASTAMAIFGVSHSHVTSDMRRQAKVVNFGVLYGMTAFRLARDLGIERSAAKTFIDGYFGLYSTVKDWIDAIVQQARVEGAVHTISGRRRVIPGIGSGDHTERQMAERMAVNSPVQGSAADLIKIAMIRLYHRIQTEQLPIKILLQVHDELVLECPEADASRLAKIVKQEMEEAFVLRVPLVAEVGVGSNWLIAH